MAITVELPELGESVVEGTVSRWLVKEGDRVERDQPLVEVTTDKVDAEIPSPAAGTVEKILVPEGETIPVGAELARLSEGEAPARAASGPATAEEAERPASGSATPERPAAAGGRDEAQAGAPSRATPVARRMAEEARVELEGLPGSGVSGRVTKRDVENRSLVAEEPTPQRAGASRTGAAGRPAEAAGDGGVRGGAARGGGASRGGAARGEGGARARAAGQKPAFLSYHLQPGDRVIPMTPLRRLVAEHMVLSKRTSPHVGTVAEVDMHGVARFRQQHKRAFQENYGFGLTYLPFIVHAVVRALREFPRLNASVLEDAIVEKKDVHVGIATETEKGLVVPVVRHADRLSLVGLAEGIEDLSSRARSKKLSADELQGGTFTVSNPGRNGNLYGFAIINQPQVGIVRMGEIVKRPVVREIDGEDAIVIRPIMHLALSYDHRAVDGAPANGFLFRIRQLLEEAEFDL